MHLLCVSSEIQISKSIKFGIELQKCLAELGIGFNGLSTEQIKHLKPLVYRNNEVKITVCVAHLLQISSGKANLIS